MTKKKKLKLGIKQKILIGIAGLLLVVIVGGIIYSNKDKTNYYTIWNAITKNELGTYRFVLDVRTQKAVDGQTNELQDTSLEAAENMESSENTENATSSAITPNDDKDFVEWSNETGTSKTDNTYPNYKVVIEGATSSIEPFTTSFDVTLATSNFNDRLTTVTVMDGKVYIDVEQLQYWLKSSKDEYLIQLGSELPENSKYMIVPESDLRLVSGYAEEVEAEKVYENNSLNYYRRFMSTISSLINAIKNSMGNTGLSSQDDIYSINLTGDDSQKLVSTITGCLKERDGLYDSVIEAQKSQGLLSDAQYQQKKNEKDNFLEATSKVYLKAMTTDLSNCKLQVQGNGRIYEGGKGTTTLEATLATAFTVDDVDYNISITGLRTGNKEDIDKPVGTESGIEQSQVWSTFGDIIEYLNITGVDFSKRIEINPDVIKDNLLDDFVELVNSTSSTSTKVTKLTVKDFIRKYMNYKETDDTTSEDRVNATLVSDFLTSISDITSNLVVEKVVADTSAGDQFLKVDNIANGIRVIADYDVKNSDEKLGVVKVTLINTTGASKKVNLTDFNLQTIISSKYPANSEPMLRDYDNKFNTKKLTKSVTVPKNGFVDETLYFLHNNGLEYMDLWYGNKKLGEIVSRAQ